MKKLIAFLALIMVAVFVISSCTTTPSESAQNSAVSSIVSATNSNVTSQEKLDESIDYSSQPETSNVNSSESIKLQDFFTVAKYNLLQSTAFSFISARERADYDAALDLVVSPDVIGSKFSHEAKSLDDLIAYYILNVVFSEEERDGKKTETASIIVCLAFEGDTGTYDYIINMDYVDYTQTIGGTTYTSKIWKVSEYYLDT